MSKLPILTAQELIRILKKIDFEIIRQKKESVQICVICGPFWWSGEW